MYAREVVGPFLGRSNVRFKTPKHDGRGGVIAERISYGANVHFRKKKILKFEKRKKRKTKKKEKARNQVF